MEYWLFGLLTFIFGYATCRTFYFVRSVRISLMLQRASQVIYLSSMIKAIEYLAQSREIMLEYLLRSERGSGMISSFEYRFDQDVKHIKKQSIETFRDIQPEFFKSRVDFQDWESAMQFLNNNSTDVFNFWSQNNDQ
mgnify:CR=1 FL=1|tara:strand:- start:264 stop:674 length:411 start_codon:yes stop_codon:yes gene_type:complete